MNKVLEYFREYDKKNAFVKNIHVYGWQLEYDHRLVSSVSNYLFEELDITENIVVKNEVNRPGTIKPNKYIVVHDTGDASPLHTAAFWSAAVFNRKWEQSPGNIVPYACSYQYVVDDKHIFHNLPDEEVAYHAGDGTKFDYTLYPSGVKATSNDRHITISTDGYYEINGVKSVIKAPRIYQEKDGVVIVDRVAVTSDINDQSILCKIIDGEYYLGETYYSTGYKQIANRGGNNNSVGIESCITKDTDLYYTWQKTAKLVARLLDQNNLTLDDVKQHHYFSGKNCPQTMRMNGMWSHFMKLVAFEKAMLEFQKEGYQIELICTDERVSKNGRIINTESLDEISYVIRTTKDNIVEELLVNMQINK